MENKNIIIIIALIAIIAALLVGLVAMMPNTNKDDTKLAFKGNATLTEGDSLKIQLTDANGMAISNQTVDVTVTDKDQTSDYHSVVTNEKGVGTLKLDKDSGKYTVTISYGGNDEYKASTATENITIKEGVVQAEVTSSQSQVSSGNPYDINNLPPSNDPYPETSREQLDENTVMQKYDDGYISYVDLRTGKRSSGGFYK